MFRSVLIDACVLVPISLCDVLLELADAEFFKPLWSEMILAEVKNALVNDIGLPEERARVRIQEMRTAFPEGMIVNFEDAIPLMKNHPKDRHVLAAAVKGGCDCILTENLGDFPSDVLTQYGVAAISPDDFLVSLLEEDSDEVWEVINNKCKSYRNPPRTMKQFCQQLGKLVPHFAAQL